jgi:outer membrane protein, adhesin transport system
VKDKGRAAKGQLLLSTVLATCLMALAAGASAETLETELRDLVQNHPQIQSKTKSVNSATEGIRAARSGWLPSVKVGGDGGPEYVNSSDRRALQGDAYMRGRETASLTVTQKIFDGFATDAAVDSAKVGRDISDSELRASRQGALLEGTLAYLDIMRQTKLIALAREGERKVQEQMNMEDERLQKGSGSASDVLAAKQRLQVAKERRVNYEGAFYTAVAKYAQVFGHSPDVAALAEAPLPMDLIPETIDDARVAAEKDNPTLESAGRTVALSNERRRGAEAGYWPTLDLVGRADYENGKSAIIGVRRDWSVLLSANWELFSGFKTNALVAQASWDHAASMDNKLYTGRKVEEQVRIAWHRVQIARQRLELLDSAASLAEEVWENQKKKHEAGKATIQDVLDDENRINDARIGYTGAYYDMFQAAYELLAAMGRLEVDALARSEPAKTPRPTLVFRKPGVDAPKRSAAVETPPAAPAAVETPAVPAGVKTAPATTPTIAPAVLMPVRADADSGDYALPDGSAHAMVRH